MANFLDQSRVASLFPRASGFPDFVGASSAFIIVTAPNPIHTATMKLRISIVAFPIHRLLAKRLASDALAVAIKPARANRRRSIIAHFPLPKCTYGGNRVIDWSGVTPINIPSERKLTPSAAAPRASS
jgi:hypothetical protein